MTRVAVVACDHGLGHVRRSVLVARALRDRGADVTLLAPREKVERVERALREDGERAGVGPSARTGSGPDAAPVAVVDLATRTTPEGLRAGDPAATHWVERLPDLGAFDAVVADTLPEVLEFRPDALLVAQFWWHDVLDGVDPGYRERAEALLADHAAPVLGSVPFAMPAVTELAGFVGVGLFVPGPDEGVTGSVDRDTLLVTGGSTTVVDDVLAPLVAGLAAERPRAFAAVLVEPHLLPGDAPPWMRPASFGVRALDRVAAAVVRPGLGIVTDLLRRGVPMRTVVEPGNREVAHNAAALEALGIGRVVGDGPGSVSSVASGAAFEGATLRPDAGLRFDGAATVAERVLGAGRGITRG